MRPTALSHSVLAGTAAATLAAGCGGAKDAHGLGQTALTPPNVFGLRVPAAIARLGNWRYRLTTPLGERPARVWIVCHSRRD